MSSRGLLLCGLADLYRVTEHFELSELQKLKQTRFPNDPFRFAKWVSIVANERGEEFYAPCKNSKICSIHFDKLDINGNTQRHSLLKSAIPKLQMCVRVWLEVGHACEPRWSAAGRALALDWRVWVRGASGADISAFVHKVVFKLRPPSAFVYPKRVLQEPPYEIQESGCASFDIPIHVYLKCSNKPKKICLRYGLHIENNNKTSTESITVYYDFENPSEGFYTALMKGGGEIISHTNNWKKRNSKLYFLFESDIKPPKNYVIKTKKYKFIEPLRCNRKHSSMRASEPYVVEDICPKCGARTDFKNELRSVAMTEEEIERVSRLYVSLRSYEKSSDALTLPPFTDPIYTVPELPTYLTRPC